MENLSHHKYHKTIITRKTVKFYTKDLRVGIYAALNTNIMIKK